MQNRLLIFSLLFIGSVLTQDEIQDNFVEFNEIGPGAGISSTSKPPPDPFADMMNEQSLDEKLDELDVESQEIVIDYVRHGRKFYGDLRRRLILYVMKFSPVQAMVKESGSGSQIQKIEKIKYRFRSGLRIKYSALKSRIDRLVAHLLAPIFAPFMLLQPEEIRPLFAAQQPQQKEPVTVPPQEITQPQSSFTALEIFPSYLPQDKWPQFDQRWMNPQPTQFSVPSFTPFYQPFQYYRSY
ncbi:uncharacterized protein CELE_F08G2.8 [Caenorhabditis elegans]|uniref:Uncharacterized protein n=1 Tax=Caenorhabditis elegans TaxID=6239 RepID=Q9XVA0_CAEEL|nr:Uncharacterized protein CELE_F08G2.8 [Caenorhabditis elegans]CAB04063.1 Uncharacterized protein CELE_F08G2.8 [Caenorhabditis elegans]|eukprot:NP_496904.1 Uncharacterized protein CELE_F08G2.8 [Caenorhabditis elegans]